MVPKVVVKRYQIPVVVVVTLVVVVVMVGVVLTHTQHTT